MSRRLEISKIQLSLVSPGTKDDSTGPTESSADCIKNSKANLKAHYDAVVKSTAKKPAAQKAAKKAMIAAYSILDSLPGTPQAKDALQSALSELELEAQ